MFKNLIISTLLIYVLSTIDGWAVQGLAKFFTCFALIILLSLLISCIEEIISDFWRWVNEI